MKTPNILFLLAIIIALQACSKQTPKRYPDEIPPCLLYKLVEGPKVCDTFMSLNQYSIKGMTFYEIDLGNCVTDMTRTYYDTNCRQIGTTNILGDSTFYGYQMNDAVFVKTLWSN